MKKNSMGVVLLLCAAMMLGACGGGANAAASQSAAEEAARIAAEEEAARIAAEEEAARIAAEEEAARLAEEEAAAAQTSDDVFQDATIHVEGRALTVTLKTPIIKNEYRCNLPSTPENMSEYLWGVDFSDGQHNFSVETVSWKFEEEECVKTIQEMQHSLFMESDDGYFAYLCGLDMEVNGTTITWTGLVPEEYEFDGGNVTITEYSICNEADSSYVFESRE